MNFVLHTEIASGRNQIMCVLTLLNSIKAGFKHGYFRPDLSYRIQRFFFSFFTQISRSTYEVDNVLKSIKTEIHKAVMVRADRFCRVKNKPGSYSEVHVCVFVV